MRGMVIIITNGFRGTLPENKKKCDFKPGERTLATLVKQEAVFT